MKLSELLDAATGELSQVAYETRRCGVTDSREAVYAKALHTIAPALVEFVAADHACDAIEDADDLETADNMDELQAAHQRLLNASTALHDALKAAGVSCE